MALPWKKRKPLTSNGRFPKRHHCWSSSGLHVCVSLEKKWWAVDKDLSLQCEAVQGEIFFWKKMLVCFYFSAGWSCLQKVNWLFCYCLFDKSKQSVSIVSKAITLLSEGWNRIAVWSKLFWILTSWEEITNSILRVLHCFEENILRKEKGDELGQSLIVTNQWNLWHFLTFYMTGCPSIW